MRFFSLVGPAGLEPATRPLWAAGWRCDHWICCIFVSVRPRSLCFGEVVSGAKLVRLV